MTLSPGRLLVLIVVINFFNYVDRYVLSAVLEPIGRELALNDQQLGWLGSAFLIVYMCTAPLFGYLADKMNRPRVLAFAVALWSIATTLSAFADSFAHLVIARAFVGIGEAAYAGIGPALLADLYREEERTSKFTWFYLAIPVGSALGYALGGAIGGAYGWRASFFVAGLPGIILALMMARQSDPIRGLMDSAEMRVSSAPGASFLKIIFTNRVWLACTASYIGYTFAMGALTHWLPTLFQRRYGVDIAEAGMVFGGMAVVTGILGTFGGGYVTKIYQNRFKNIGVDISVVTLFLSVFAIYASLNAQTSYGAYVGLFVGMLLLFINTSPINVILISKLPASVRASGVALNVFLIHLLGDAISPVLVGERSNALGASGDALASALNIVLPAIVFSAFTLVFARSRHSQR